LVLRRKRPAKPGRRYPPRKKDFRRNLAVRVRRKKRKGSSGQFVHRRVEKKETGSPPFAEIKKRLPYCDPTGTCRGSADLLQPSRKKRRGIATSFFPTYEFAQFAVSEGGGIYYLQPCSGKRGSAKPKRKKEGSAI